MIHELFASLLLATTMGTPLIRTTPLKANLTQIGGLYNFRNYIDTNYINKYTTRTTAYITLDTSFEEGTGRFTNPIRYNEEDFYLNGIYLTINPNDSMGIEFEYYDRDLEGSTLNLTWYLEDDLSELENESQDQVSWIYFNIRDSILADETASDLFNAIFTHEENWYVKNYTGWYSFSSTAQGLSWVANMYGNVTMGQRMYYSAEISGNFINAMMYDPANDIYKYDTMALPFSTSQRSTQWYLNGVKMTNGSRLHWESVGTFSYVPTTQPGEYSFSDLFFDLADTPIYFIYSIFNWELFGANLFIAFIGLTSFALILVLFRKFL